MDILFDPIFWRALFVLATLAAACALGVLVYGLGFLRARLRSTSPNPRLAGVHGGS